MNPLIVEQYHENGYFVGDDNNDGSGTMINLSTEMVLIVDTRGRKEELSFDSFNEQVERKKELREKNGK